MSFKVGDIVTPNENGYENWPVLFRLRKEGNNLIGTIIKEMVQKDFLVQFNKEYEGMHKGELVGGEWTSENNDCYFLYMSELQHTVNKKFSLEEML